MKLAISAFEYFGRSRRGIRRPSGSNKGPQSKEPSAQRKRVQHGQLRAGHRPRLGFAAFASGVAVLATHSLKTEQIQERGSTPLCVGRAKAPFFRCRHACLTSPERSAGTSAADNARDVTHSRSWQMGYELSSSRESLSPGSHGILTHESATLFLPSLSCAPAIGVIMKSSG